MEYLIFQEDAIKSIICEWQWQVILVAQSTWAGMVATMPLELCHGDMDALYVHLFMFS